MLSETFEERLKEWIDPNYYERSSDLIVVEETKKGSEAKIHCAVSNDVIKMKLEKNPIQYLKRKNVADAVLFEFVEPQKIKLHIIECKQKVKEKEWNRIKEQFEGAFLNALAVLGILGLSDINIHDVAFYTAYKNDELSVKENPNFASLKTGVGKPFRNVPSDWENDRVSILSINAHHQKICLDDNREARIAL